MKNSNQIIDRKEFFFLRPHALKKKMYIALSPNLQQRDRPQFKKQQFNPQLAHVIRTQYVARYVSRIGHISNFQIPINSQETSGEVLGFLDEKDFQKNFKSTKFSAPRINKILKKGKRSVFTHFE